MESKEEFFRGRRVFFRESSRYKGFDVVNSFKKFVKRLVIGVEGVSGYLEG